VDRPAADWQHPVLSGARTPASPRRLYIGSTEVGQRREWIDMAGRAVALSGELGSGKSEVSSRLARALGARRVSTGEAQRSIAHQRGISTLELNRLAEIDRTIDDEIDGVFRSLASTPNPLVVDSRLAWHFLPRSYKVHLVVDPKTGASRVLNRTKTNAEHYASLDLALEGMAHRVESERRRFQELYGVDIFRLANYDLVVDTTQASPEEVTEAVLARWRGASPALGRPELLLSPGRVDATGDGDTDDHGVDEDGQLRVLEAEVRRHGISSLEPIVVSYRRPEFTLVDGRRQLRVADRCGLVLLPAVLAGDPGNEGSDEAS
jgi:CMP/dCMP kinase